MRQLIDDEVPRLLARSPIKKSWSFTWVPSIVKA